MKLKQSRKMLLPSILMIILVTLFVPIIGAKAATNITCGGWNIVANPNPGTSSSQLNGLTARAANDVWAVGGYASNSTGLDQTLVEHWDGTAWSVVTSPNPGTATNTLIGVTHVPYTNHLWAVGYYTNRNGNFSGPRQTLVEFWNGTKWSIVTSPNVGTQDNSLNAVAVVSATDIWAVGIYTDETLSLQYTLTEHWNGKQWSVVASPSPGVYDNELSGVTAFSSKNIWAVGYTSPVGPEETLIEHWDGTVWSIVSSPSPGNGLNQLFGVAKIPGTNHVWAVGSFNNTNSGTLSLIERWNGTKWSVIPNPDPGSSNTALYGVVALAKNDAWAVGYTANANNKSKTLTEHWDGTQWSVVPSPSITSENNLLVSVASVAGTTQLWTAGGSFSGTGTGETLTELYC